MKLSGFLFVCITTCSPLFFAGAYSHAEEVLTKSNPSREPATSLETKEDIANQNYPDN